MNLVLDLNTFETPEAEGSRYVLTSPRSLEACARMKVRPVELLPKTMDDFVDENPEKPLPLLQVFHDNHELKRIELLQKCRDMRNTIIMENKVAEKKKSNEISNGKLKNVAVSTSNPPQRNSEKIRKEKNAVTMKPREQKPQQDENNNSTNTIYGATTPRNPKKSTNHLSTPRLKDPLTPGRASFVKSKSKSSDHAEDPYMISTPIAPRKFGTKSIDKDRKMPVLSQDSSPRSRALINRSLQSRTRSRSLETWKRRSHPEIQLASSLKFAGSGIPSGASTPQQQRDQKIVEMMKEKRKQTEEARRKISEKEKEWDEEKRMEEKKRKEEHMARERSLRQSQLEWEKRIKEREDRRVRELKRSELEKQAILEETEKQIERNKKEQERLQRAIIEERRRSELLKKQQQEAAKKSVENEIQAFQEATEREIDQKLGKAQRTKLEIEMKEMSKLQFLNKSQREKFVRLERELKKRHEQENEQKRSKIEEKLEKAEILRTRKISERDHSLKQQAKQGDQKILRTKEKQEELNRKNEEHLQSIAEHKKELLKRANSTYSQNIQTKSKRAQKMREESQEEQRRRLKQIAEEDEKHLAETKETLEAKDERSKMHQHLKEAAIQISRANARAAEAARSEVKQKDDTFLEGIKHAAFMRSIGRGPRTGLVNTSTVKFG